MGKRLFAATILAVILFGTVSGCGLCRRYRDPCYDPCGDPSGGPAPRPVVRSGEPCQ